MKNRWMTTGLTTILAAGGLILATGAPALGQDGRWEDMADRIGGMVERALVRAGWAADRGRTALANMDWEARLDALGASEWQVGTAEADREAGPQAREEFRWAGTVAAGEVLEIKGVNGPISAIPADGDRVEVVALKTGRRNDPAEVEIQVLEHDGGVTLCAIYPSTGREANECGAGDEGRNSVRRNDVRVAWEVRVPEGVLFHGRTVNGSVEATDLTEAVDLTTVNGDVVVSTRGFATARTVNGSIRGRMDGAMVSEASFETVNGSISLDVDEDLDADIDAAWLNGRLDTEIPFRIQGRVGRRSAKGVLGDGGPTLKLRTVNGSIRIH